MSRSSDRPLLSFGLYVVGAVGMLLLLVVAGKAGVHAQQVRLGAVGWWLAVEGLRLWVGSHRRRTHRNDRFSVARWPGR